MKWQESVNKFRQNRLKDLENKDSKKNMKWKELFNKLGKIPLKYSTNEDVKIMINGMLYSISDIHYVDGIIQYLNATPILNTEWIYETGHITSNEKGFGFHFENIVFKNNLKTILNHCEKFGGENYIVRRKYENGFQLEEFYSFDYEKFIRL